MSDVTPPVPDLTPIRARLEKVAEAARMGEISVFNNEHIASWGDIDALLREVDRLRGEMEKAESRLTALDDNRDKWKARAESAEARLAAVQALPVQWRGKSTKRSYTAIADVESIRVGVERGERECAADLDAALQETQGETPA